MDKKKIKNIILNFVKNIFAYALPVALLQFFVQPIIAKKIGEELNGLFLTILALNYFLTNITAATLLQTRLLLNDSYVKKNVTGDFNIILIFMGAFNSFIMIMGCLLYSEGSFDKIDIFMCVVLSILFLVHDYICVQYRIELDFTKILISNVVLCIGYVIGLCLFVFVIHKWQIVFVVAYLICEIYDISHTNYLREKLIITPMMKTTLLKYFTLAAASLLTYIVSYGDRMLLYPATNGSTVSIFTSAEIIGKMLMLLGSPLSAFLLSYIVKLKKLDVTLLKKKYMFISIGLIVLSYVFCVVISAPTLYILYPKWADQSLEYVPFVTLTSMINLIAMIINVIVVRFCRAKWQIVINSIYLVSYIVFSFGLLHFYGLIGFCIGNIISAFIKLGCMIIVIYKKIKATK